MKIPLKLQKLSKKDKGSLAVRSLKLCEESGEVAEATLRLIGRKSSNGKGYNALTDDVIEESIDTMIMCMDILTVLNFTNEKKINSLITKKLNKWSNSVRINSKELK